MLKHFIQQKLHSKLFTFNNKKNLKPNGNLILRENIL